MAFKVVASLEADVTISLGGRDKKTGKANPNQVEGYYLGRRVVAPNKYSKPGKTDYLYFFQTPKGNLGVWGKTDLDRKMGNVTPGTMVRASHAGMRPTPNGDMHTFTVEIDEENTIDVSGFNQVPAPSYADDNAEDDIEAVGDNEEDAVEVAAAPRKALNSSIAERAAKMQELLGKGKK